MTAGGASNRVRSRLTAWLDRAPAGLAPPAARILWGAWVAAAAAGLAAWLIDVLTGSVAAGVTAMWLFVAAAAIAGVVLPLPLALVAPLYLGLLGWLVDMLPLVILVGWGAAIGRWAVGLILERRLPRGGQWVLLPSFLFAWTVLGAQNVAPGEMRHFLLLVGIQGASSGAMLAVVDAAAGPRDRDTIVVGLVGFGLVSTIGVALVYFGVPLQEVQDEEVSERIEEAYGLDAFPNSTGVLNYVLASRGGGGELRRRLDRFRHEHPETPDHNVYLPPFRAFEDDLVVRFAGPATAVEDELAGIGVDLVYDNVGIFPSNKVPRWRSFARNSLTYAGVCVALFPLAFYLAWTGEAWRRRLGRAGVAACLAGAGFALARGAWLALLIAIVYLAVEGTIEARRKIEMAASFLAAAIILTVVFVVGYGVDPLTGRARGEGSIGTRASVYEDTLQALSGKQVLFGFGTTTVRGTSYIATRYIPRAGTHSTYLNYVFRTGVPGVFALIAIYVTAWLHARAAARMRTGNDRVFATAIAASVIGFAVHGAVLSLYVEPIYTLTISLIVGLALAVALKLPGTVLAVKPRRSR